LKLCWDNLEGFYLTKVGNLKKGSSSYIEMESCAKRGKTIDEVQIHCHHITGVKQNPIESADIDNCITLCKNCHKEVHQQDGCKYYELKCIGGL